jgi:hypothetical protein
MDSEVCGEELGSCEQTLKQGCKSINSTQLRPWIGWIESFVSRELIWLNWLTQYWDLGNHFNWIQLVKESAAMAGLGMVLTCLPTASIPFLPFYGRFSCPSTLSITPSLSHDPTTIEAPIISDCSRARLAVRSKPVRLDMRWVWRHWSNREPCERVVDRVSFTLACQYAIGSVHWMCLG